jgi:hypothetical protein
VLATARQEEKTASRNGTKGGAMCAVGGSIVLFVGTYLHLMDADPNDAVAGFTEYAADHLWIASHLTQLAGVALIVLALLFLAQQLEAASGTAWARIAAAGAIASLALACVLQAVDGIALKRAVDAWAAAAESQKDTAFQAAFAVRQVEIGLASMVCLAFGLTAIVCGRILLFDRVYPKWLAALAILGGAPTTVAGVVIAYTGFSTSAMAINMPANFVLLVWMLALGVCMWGRGKVRRMIRRANRPSRECLARDQVCAKFQ